MGTLKDAANQYEPKSLKNIAELNEVSTDLEIFEDLDAEFPYKYVLIGEERYKINVSVLSNLKAILEEQPKLKKFKVKKSGDGMNTRYAVIPLA